MIGASTAFPFALSLSGPVLSGVEGGTAELQAEPLRFAQRFDFAQPNGLG